MSKFGKYFLIVLLALIGLCAIGVLYLFIVPNSSIFGICYISCRDNYNSIMYNVDENIVNSIALNSRNYEVEIETTSSSNRNIYVKVFANSFGYVLKKNSYVSIDAKLVAGDLTINVGEPYGACFKKKSKITLFVPEDYLIDLKLNNKDAKTSISSEKLAINNLIATTSNGEFNLNNCSINSIISVSLNRGNFNLGSGVATNNNSVEFKTNTGNFNAQNSSLGAFEVKANTRGMIKVKQCTDFHLDNDSAGGSIELGQVENVNISSSDTNVKIGTINSGAYVNLTTSGSVDVDEIKASTTFITKDGNINVGKITANSACSFTTTGNGDIKLNSVFAAIMAESKYGDISVCFDDSSESYSIGTSSRNLNAITADGKIYANNVEHLDVDITGSGSAEIYMSKITGDNTVKSISGSVYVQFADDCSFVLNTDVKNNVANINCIQFTEIGEENHNFTDRKSFFINTISENGNSLSITSSSGYIKVRDYTTRNTD